MVKTTENERFPVRCRIRLPRFIYREGHIFFVTIGTQKRHPWFRRHLELSALFVEILNRTADERETKLFAWCIMPDHVHLLTQDPDIVELVRLLKGRMTPHARRYDLSRRLWQRSFYDHGLRKEESIERVAQYIFENPVRSGLTNVAVDYPWSGSNVWPNWSESYDLVSGRG
jgi:putative transposase